MNSGPEHHSARELVIYTGEDGMSMVNRMIRIENMKDLLEWMVGKSMVDDAMVPGLRKMLDADDPESVDLAMGIIHAKFRE